MYFLRNNMKREDMGYAWKIATWRDEGVMFAKGMQPDGSFKDDFETSKTE